MSESELQWLDLYVEGDTHPRRFDKPESVRAYLTKVERLGEEGISTLLGAGEVSPPLTRRRYWLELLTVPTPPERTA
ncbi:hypothetical protein EHF33_09765 [Deinococcus psychrotolerans]|uniref:Uncharacterized protein n=2 Tax=Deinococcus TaxID=1298 RepID=A0A553V5T7_9DEIO|nr:MULTISPECIES: hypothetical protein [Deinococcus]AZI42991.1 hypothetical protein EHF33_09765 [Deinococcus psychrotolerans]TSA87764.1 hypothetical protein FNU79_00420 [Deinococcus detaillensis]